MEDDKIQQAALMLELAEHNYLRALGWKYVTREPNVLGDGTHFVWEAPPTHKGSSRYYASRAHAINSVKRWMVNQGNTNPLQRLTERTNGANT